MRRRMFLAAGLGLVVAPSAAQAQAALSFAPIRPENELERAFLAAADDEAARTAFRRELMRAQVALALANSAPDSGPRLVAMGPQQQAGLIYSSATRLAGVLGPATPRLMLTGRQAFERLTGHGVVFNYRLTPMLTLEAEDVRAYLTTPA